MPVPGDLEADLVRIQLGLVFHSLEAFLDRPAVSGDPGQCGQDCGAQGVVTVVGQLGQVADRTVDHQPVVISGCRHVYAVTEFGIHRIPPQMTQRQSQLLACRQRLQMTAFKVPLGELHFHQLQYVCTCSQTSALVCAQSTGRWTWSAAMGPYRCEPPAPGRWSSTPSTTPRPSQRTRRPQRVPIDPTRRTDDHHKPIHAVPRSWQRGAPIPLASGTKNCRAAGPLFIFAVDVGQRINSWRRLRSPLALGVRRDMKPRRGGGPNGQDSIK